MNSDEVALHDDKVPPQGSSHAVSLEANATVQPPLVTERNMRRLKFKSPGKTEASMKNQPSMKPMMQGKERADIARTTSRTAGAEREVPSDPAGMEAADWAGKTVHLAQVESIVPERSFAMGDDTYKSRISQTTDSPEHHSKTRKTRTIGCTMALMKTATGQEAASAQMVKRGHQVTMIEVPDEDNDVSFQRWLATGSPITSPKPHTTTLPTPPNSLKTLTKTLHWDS